MSADDLWWDPLGCCPDCGRSHVRLRPGKTQPTCDCHETCAVHGRNKIIYHCEGVVPYQSGYFCLDCWRAEHDR